MKKSIHIILLILVHVLSVYSQGAIKLPKNNVYKGGEKLGFVLRYGPIIGGVASLELKHKKIDGQNTIHAYGVVKTIGLADKLFRVKDIYESYFIEQTGLPVKAVRNIKEGSYTFYNIVTFDQSNNLVYSQKSGQYEVPAGILDMVSIFYFIRRIDFSKYKTGHIFPFVTFFGDEIFPFDIRYKGIETIKTKLGTFECYKFAPKVEPGRMFESEDDMLVWITTDDNHLPVRAQLDLLIGSINCDLVEYANLRNKFVSKKKK